MTKAFSRSFKSSNLDSRASRKATGGRSERELDDWRDRAPRVDEDDEDLDVYGDDVDARDDDPLEAVSRRLARSSGRPDSRRFRNEPDEESAASRDRADHIVDPREIAESAAALVTRRVAKSERQTARALANIAELIENGRHRLDPEVVEGAVAAIEQRVGQTERKTAKALENIAEMIETSARSRSRGSDDLEVVVDRLGRIESKMAQQPESSVRPIRSALARLESRIDRLSNDGRAENFEQALSGLDQRLAEIAARLDADVRERQAKPSRLQSAAHETIGQESYGSREREERPVFDRAERSPARAKRPLAEAITEIARRQRSLDADTFAPEPLPRRDESRGLDATLALKRFDEVQAGVEALARRFEAMQGDAGGRSDQLPVLMRQIEGLRRQIQESSSAEHPAVARRFEDLGKSVELLSSQIQAVRGGANAGAETQLLLTRQVEALRRQIEQSSGAEHPAVARRFDDLRGAVEKLSVQIEAMRGDVGERSEAQLVVMRQIETLRRQIEETSRAEHPAVGRRFDDLSGMVEALSHQIEARANGADDASDQLFALTRQIEALRRRIDETTSAEHPAIARRFDDLSEMVESLSRRIETDKNGATDHAEELLALTRRIEPLGRQIEEISRAGLPSVAGRFDDLREVVERLSGQIEAVKDKVGDHAGEMLPLTRQMESLRRQIEESSRAEHPAIARRFDDLRKMVEQLSGQIAAAKESAGDRSAELLPLMRQMEILRRRIEESSGVEHPAVARRFDELRKMVEQLAGQIEAVKKGAGDRSAELLPLTRQMEALQRRIEESSRAEHPAVARRFDDLRKMVEQLASQIEAVKKGAGDRSAELLPLTRQMETLQRRIEESSRAEHPAVARRFDDLRKMVEQLASQIEAVKKGAGDRSAELLPLTRQIETLRGQIEETSRAEHPAVARRFDTLREAVDGLSGRLDGLREDVGRRSDRQEQVIRQVEALHNEIESVSRTLGDLAPRASIVAIESVLRDLALRIESQRDRGVEDTALAPAERIAGELRSVLKELDPAPHVRNLQTDLHAISSRLDAMQAPGAVDAKALGELGRQTAEIKELLSALASRPLPLEKLETRLFDLTQRVESLSVGAQMGGGGSKDIGELVKAIRSIVVAETGNGLNGFNQQLERLSDKFEDAIVKFGGKRFDELGARIDDMHKSLAQRIDRGVAAQKPADTGALESIVATLAKKIDSALDAKAYNPAFDELGRKLEKLEARLQDPASAETIARIEKLLARPGQEGHFSDLAQRIDQIGKTLTSRLQQDGFAQGGVELGNIEQLVRGLGERIDAALEPGAGRRDLEQLEQQVELLSQKLDRLADSPTAARIEELLAQPQQTKQLHELSDRIDFMHNALAARIEEGVRVRTESSKNQLSELVEALARKMNGALDNHADPSALNALENQIKQLSARLDRTDGNGSALAAIEHKLAEVFGRIEETRTSASEAAEAAVRRATLDVLRQVSATSGALDPAFKNELDDLRRNYEESGARTHETLSAVHETLERVVDRLAAFEEEITEIRTTPPAHGPASAENEAARRDAQKITDELTRLVAREPMRLQVADETGDRLEPNVAAPARRARLVEDELDLDALPKAEPRGSDSATQSNFIAAARRAAQQAAADAEAAEAARKNRRPSVRAPEEARAEAESLGSTIIARKRPILLGLAALVTMAGVYQMAHYARHPGGGEATQVAHESASNANLNALSSTNAQKEAPPSEPPAAPAANPEKTLSPIAPLPKFPQSQNAAPRSADAPTTPGLGLTPIGPSGGVPTMAPKVGGKSATSEPVDNTPVGAINGPAASPQETATTLKALATRGDASAQYELAVRYSEGRGIPRDTKAAVQWFEKAAEQGLAPAQYRLGSYFEKGIGVDRDYARARSYYQQAAESGNARAMHNLAVLCAEGNDGKPDYAAASEWFRKAAELGVRDSQYNLAILYARGLGVGQSMTQSYMWFAIAAAQGDQDAGKKRDEVGARLDSKDLAAAKGLVDGFKPRPLTPEANEITPPRGGWENVRIQQGKPGKAKVS